MMNSEEEFYNLSKYPNTVTFQYGDPVSKAGQTKCRPS